MRMSKQRKGLVPELRFSGFSEQWEVKALAPYLKQHSIKVPSSTELDVFSSTREGLKSQNEYFDGSNLTNKGEYGVVPEGYFVYRHMSDDNIFKFNINKLGKQIAVSKEYPVFKTQNLDPGFLLNVLNEGRAFKAFAASQKKGGTRTRLYFKTLGTFELPLPSPKEQQKIADCLASIDELITLHTKKLGALKAHTKGLMQQLFPTARENVPKLRFPEFRGKEDWIDTVLADLCEMQAGKFVKASEICELRTEGLYPCYGGNGLRGFTKTYTHDGTYSLIGRQGALCGNVTLVGNKFHATEHAVVVTPKEGVRTDWLYFLLIYLELNRYATGQAQPGLSVENLNKVELKFTSLEEEQRKIASLLSTSQELIDNQILKIEQLRTHKKGLMQKLFPAMDEVK